MALWDIAVRMPSQTDRTWHLLDTEVSTGCAIEYIMAVQAVMLT